MHGAELFKNGGMRVQEYPAEGHLAEQLRPVPPGVDSDEQYSEGIGRTCGDHSGNVRT